MTRPRTALLAQELGMGLWHAGLLGAIARALEDVGFHCIFALADPVLARRVLRPSDVVVPAPVYVPPGAMLPPTLSTRTFADILGASGWGDAATVGALMASWDALVGLVRPDVVIADHAPTLLAWARGHLPRVSVGLGFTTPPATLATFPDLHGGPPGSYSEGAVLACVNAALGERGRPALERLPQAFDADATFVTVMAELDPYHAARDEPALGPVGPVPGLLRLPARDAVFAYLAADDARTAPVLAALAGLGPVRAYVRGADREARAALGALGVDVAEGPLEVATALAEADVVVHHGGAGMTQDAALAGRPQLLLPRYLEQGWNAHVARAQGVGAVVGALEPEAIDAALATLRLPRARGAARAWATVAGAQVSPDGAGRIADRCLALTAGR